MNDVAEVDRDDDGPIPARRMFAGWLAWPRTWWSRLLVFVVAALTCGIAVAPYHEFSIHVHADERGKIEQIQENTRNHHHPLLNLTLVDMAVDLFGVDRENSHDVAVAGRRVSIVLTGLAAGMLVLLAFEVAALPGAAAAWLLLLFHPRMFRFAHFFKEDPAMLLGLSIFAWLVVRWLLHGGEWGARRRWLWMIALGVSLAMAGTAKWVGYFWLPWGLLAVVGCCPRGVCVKFGKRVGLAMVVLITALLLSTVVQWRALNERAQLEESLASEVERLADTEYSKNQDSVPHKAYLDAMMGKPARVTLILGLVYLVALGLGRTPWKRSAGEVIVVLSILSYLVMLSFVAKTADRYLLPGYAFFCVFAALGVVCLWAAALRIRKKGWRYAAVALATAMLVFSSYRMLRGWQWEVEGVTSFELQREMADWLRDTLPEGAKVVYSSRVALVDPTYPEQFASEPRGGAIEELPFPVVYVEDWEVFETLDAMRESGFSYAVLGSDEWRKGKAQAKLNDEKSQRSRFWQDFFRGAKKIHEIKPRNEWSSHFQHKAYVYDLSREGMSE